MRAAVAVSVLFALTVPPSGALADEAAAKAIIDKALAAHGGAEKVTQFKAAIWSVKGKLTILGVANPVVLDWSVQYPNRARVAMEVDTQGVKNSILRVIDGDKGWVNLGIQPADMDPEEIAEEKEKLYGTWVQMLVSVREPGLRFSALPEAKVRERPAAGVRIKCEGRRDIDMWFDKETGLRVRSVTKVKDEITGIEVQQESLYSDEKDFHGVKHPTKVLIRRLGRTFLEAQVTGFKPLDKLDAAVFAKPKE